MTVMKLLTYRDGGEERLGVAVGGQVWAAHDLGFPGSLLDLIRAGEATLQSLRAAVENGPSGVAPMALSEIAVTAPILRPIRSIFCAGKTYADHAAEYGTSGYDKQMSAALPDKPVIFFKLVSSVIGPYDDIEDHADVTSELDYEAELAVVIGKAGRRIPESAAMDHVFGYMLLNDVTARDWQKGHDQWVVGKSFDTFCPMGPFVVTADEAPEMEALEYRCSVNGELRQVGRPADLLFNVASQLSYFSQGITLQPGDIISTGSPTGVGIGFKPPRFLKAGDRVRIESELLGVMENRVV